MASSKLIDLVVDLATSTVKQLRDRARRIRDKHSMKKHFRGLWSWRKKELVRKLAEAELSLLPPSANQENEIMLLRAFEALVAKHTVQGVARGFKAAGSDNIEQFREMMEDVAQQALEGQEVFGNNGHGLVHTTNGEEKKEEKKEDGKKAKAAKA